MLPFYQQEMLAARTVIIAPRMAGKRQAVEFLVKQFGGFIARPGGIFRWNGKRWRKVRKTRPLEE